MDRVHLKNSTGYLKEKAIITLNRFTGDDIDKSILKSTSHMLKVPKERYVQRLIAASNGRAQVSVKQGRPISEYIIDALQRRLHSHNWVIVLKTLVVLHRLISDASEAMTEYIIQKSCLFDMSKLKHFGNSHDALNQAKFILQYINYLKDRVELQRCIGSQFKLDSAEYETHLSTLSPAALLPDYDALLCLLDFPLYVSFSAEVVNNSCTMEAYELLIHDAKRLFCLVSERMVFVLDCFDDLTLMQKRDWLKVLKRYSSCAQHLKEFFETVAFSKLIFVEKVPLLKMLSSDIVDDIEFRVECSSAPNQVCSLKSLGIESVSAAKDMHAVKKDPVNVTTSSSLEKPSKMIYKDATCEAPKPKLDLNSLFDTVSVAQSGTRNLSSVLPPTYMMLSVNSERSTQSAPPTSWSSGAPSLEYAAITNNSTQGTYDKIMESHVL